MHIDQERGNETSVTLQTIVSGGGRGTTPPFVPLIAPPVADMPLNVTSNPIVWSSAGLK
jgi:hypothetical protein